MKTKLLQNLATIMLFLLVKCAWAQPFVNQIKAPPLYSNPSNKFSLYVRYGTHNFSPLPGTTVNDTGGTAPGPGLINFDGNVPTFYYDTTNGTSSFSGYLGPTMVWRTDKKVQITVYDKLNMRTTVHWHGVNLPAELDGGPQEPFGSDSPFAPAFNLIDPVQTCWYHSHLMDSTTYQVIKGLAGMIILENPSDPIRSNLPHDYGTNDFPVVIQEVAFTVDSTTRKVNGFDTISAGGTLHTPGKGRYTLVNGVLNGYMDVPSSVVRLRLLNGSYRKTYAIGISTDSVINAVGDTLQMWLVATDGGYTKVSSPLKTLIIGPGERYEVLVDLRGKANGSSFYLRNRPLPRGFGNTNIGYVTGDFSPTIGGSSIMKFVVNTSIAPPTPINTNPGSIQLDTAYKVDTSDVHTGNYRYKVLGNTNGGGGGGPFWTIDGDTMNMDLINDIIQVNSQEIWSIKNTTNIYHPFHIHKVQFQVLDIRDTSGNVLQSHSGVPAPLPVNMMGYKDDVLIPAYGTIRFVARFDSFPSPEINPMYAFMYHCHILTHEDNSMMQQFVVVDTVQIKAGIRKLSQKGNFMLYPNPAGNILNLKGSSTSAGTLRITDILGRTLREEKVMPFNGVIPVDIADLPRGMVFVEWNSGNTHFIQKVLLR